MEAERKRQAKLKAEKLQKDLSSILNQKIYIVFEAPNYKVRVGNFVNDSTIKG